MQLNPIPTILYAVIIITLVAAHWRLFTKAGEAGWKSLIPIYSDYTLFKIVWNTTAFWVYAASSVLYVLFMLTSGAFGLDAAGQLVMAAQPNLLISFLAMIAGIVFVVYYVKSNLRTAQAFGRNAIFGLGLILLPNIFAMILAFGRAQYQGPVE